MATLNPSDPTTLLAILAELIATFGPTVFMLQSRHYGIDDHERKLQDRYEELMKAGAENSEHCRNILDQIDVVRKRYDAALTAFILSELAKII